jgi:hypothetical protein
MPNKSVRESTKERIDKAIDEVLIKYGCLNKMRNGSLTTLQGALSDQILGLFLSEEEIEKIITQCRNYTDPRVYEIKLKEALSTTLKPELLIPDTFMGYSLSDLRKIIDFATMQGYKPGDINTTLKPSWTSEELEIQKLEAKMFLKVLDKFHNLALSTPRGTENIFWNDVCGIRQEYLKELEKMDCKQALLGQGGEK